MCVCVCVCVRERERERERACRTRMSIKTSVSYEKLPQRPHSSHCLRIFPKAAEKTLETAGGEQDWPVM